MEWRSGLGAGIGEILDLSPGGAGFRVPVREAFQVGPAVALSSAAGDGPECDLADDAKVTHKTPDRDGTCRIGVEFTPLPLEDEPDDQSLAGIL